MNIGFIGSGIMGRPMAENLMRAGHKLFVYGRRFDRIEPMLVAGALGKGTPAEVAASADISFTVLSTVLVQRRRVADREQLHLFGNLAAGEPGDARVTLSATLRANLAARHVVTLSASRYHALSSPVARRLYRILEVARADGRLSWRVSLERLAEQMPLTQRYPSHLQRVLQPAHEMLLSAGLVRDIAIRQYDRQWHVDYVLGSRPREEG
jgi:hypothetical protein